MLRLVFQDYESDGEEEGGDVDLENQYYTAKGHKEADPDKAFKAFQQVALLSFGFCFGC